MKTNSTQLVLVRAIIFLLVLLYSLLVFGKPVHQLKATKYYSEQKCTGVHHVGTGNTNQVTFHLQKSQLVFVIVKRDEKTKKGK